MGIEKRNWDWAAFAALGGMASPALAAPMLIPCSHCVILGTTESGRPMRQRPKAVQTSPRLGYDSSFHSGPAAAAGVSDRFASRLFGSAGDGFAIETSRRVVKRAISPDRTGGTREKLSSGSLLLHYDGHVGEDDMLSLGIGGSYEKRRFALDLSNGHMIRSRSVGVEGAWSHGTHWRLSAGYRDDMGGKSSSALARAIEMAEGAGRTQQGPWMAIAFTPGDAGKEPPVSFGLRMQAMHLSQSDRLALGATSRQDNRVAFTTSIRFR